MLSKIDVMICSACGSRNVDGAGACTQCGALLGDALGPGTIVASRYEILSALGSGGMGRVYKAHDRVLDERVALKVLRPEFGRDASMARRFQSEIKLARKVTHRNVCRIYEYGQDGTLQYISMEFVSGTDLKHVLRVQGGLLAEGAFEVTLEIGAGLEAIHEVGIIHRDLKTPNIMLDSRGTVRLLDFGIAKQTEAHPTQSGLVIGTPEYMSPEQAQGYKVDFRSDVYALGIVVFELFTGHVPFEGETAVATLYKHVHEPPPLDSAQAEGMPRGLVAVLKKALSKDPDGRYATAAEMTKALRQVQASLFGPPPTLPQETVAIAASPSPVSRPAADDPTSRLLSAQDRILAVPAGAGRVAQLLNVLLETSKELSGAASGRVLIFGSAGSAERVIEVCVGESREELTGLCLEPGEGIAPRAAETGETVLVPAAVEDRQFSPRCDSLPGGPGFLCVGLHEGSLRGAISLSAGRDGFTLETADKVLRLARFGALAIENATVEERSVAAFVHSSELLVSFLERVDPHWAGHSREVAALTQLVGAPLGLSDLEQRQLYFAAFLHDVGKFRLDPAILRPGPLSDVERRVMQEHVVLGVQLLTPITPWEEVLRIIYAHHERWDGSGYPRGLKSEEIPLGARIVAVADVFDAMSRDKERPRSEVLKDLEALAGKQFDPRVVEVFVSQFRDRPALLLHSVGSEEA
jgi:putative nucleotidyltransferase with HDIG domain